MGAVLAWPAAAVDSGLAGLQLEPAERVVAELLLLDRTEGGPGLIGGLTGTVGAARTAGGAAAPPLGLLQPHLRLALVRRLLLFAAADPVLLVAPPLLDVLAGSPLGVLAGLALRLDTGPGVRFFLANPVVLDPTELFQREEDRVLTLLGHVVRSPTGDNKPAPLFSFLSRNRACRRD